MTKNTTKTWRTNMKIKEKFYKDKYLKKIATEINYKMHLRTLLQQGGMTMVYRRKLGLETHVKWLL